MVLNALASSCTIPCCVNHSALPLPNGTCPRLTDRLSFKPPLFCTPRRLTHQLPPFLHRCYIQPVHEAYMIKSTMMAGVCHVVFAARYPPSLSSYLTCTHPPGHALPRLNACSVPCRGGRMRCRLSRPPQLLPAPRRRCRVVSAAVTSPHTRLSCAALHPCCSDWVIAQPSTQQCGPDRPSPGPASADPLFAVRLARQQPSQPSRRARHVKRYTATPY